MNLSRRFAILVLALVVSVTATCAAGLIAINRLNDAMQVVVGTGMKRLLVVTNVRRQFRSMVVAERDHLLEKDAAKQAALAAKMLKTRSDLKAELARYEELMPASEREVVDSLKGAYTRWVEIDDRVLGMSTAGELDGAVPLAGTHANDPVSWEKVIAGMVAANEQRLEEQVAATTTTHATARLVILLVSGLATLLAMSLGTALFVGIRRAVAEVVRLNGDLEQQVQDRTAALERRERSMQLVLDSMAEGLMSIDLDRRILPERSAVIATWFGEPAAEITIDELLFPIAEQREAFVLAFEQLRDDILPFELSASQMPARFVRDGAHFELGYRQVFENGAFSKVLVTILDVTIQVASERAEKDAREQHLVIASLLRDRFGFEQFVHESERLIAAMALDTSIVSVRRMLHTLKGNAGLFGFNSVADRCHLLEQELADTERLLTASESAELAGLWRSRILAIDEFFHRRDHDVVMVRDHEYHQLLEHIEDRRDHDALLGIVQSWRWERTFDHLVGLGAQTDRLAARLQKRVSVGIEHHELRVPPGFLAEFWPTLVHVIRNAVDHGIEAPEARIACGKDPVGTIAITTEQDAHGQLVIRISDDGAGLDVPALLARARAKGIRVAPGQAAHDVLFEDGITTRDAVTDVSGRGVGMSAVRDACHRAGGLVAVESAPGRGTSFAFYFPLGQAIPHAA